MFIVRIEKHIFDVVINLPNNKSIEEYGFMHKWKCLFCRTQFTIETIYIIGRSILARQIVQRLQHLQFRFRCACLVYRQADDCSNANQSDLPLT